MDTTVSCRTVSFHSLCDSSLLGLVSLCFRKTVLAARSVKYLHLTDWCIHPVERLTEERLLLGELKICLLHKKLILRNKWIKQIEWRRKNSIFLSLKSVSWTVMHWEKWSIHLMFCSLSSGGKWNQRDYLIHYTAPSSEGRSALRACCNQDTCNIKHELWNVSGNANRWWVWSHYWLEHLTGNVQPMTFWRSSVFPVLIRL